MRRAAPALLAASLAACATGATLRGRAQAIQADVDRAHDAAGLRCAPRELALAEAHLEFARRELADGDASRAEAHLAVAEQNARRADELAGECRKKVAVQPPPRIVKKVQDSDGDGVPDDIDRCPLDPEDRDGFQDEDGCPDADNDGDGIVDAMDACPNNVGPLENRGCPILDRDGDGVPDGEDRCPDEPGPPPEGCPRRYALVEVKKDRIEIRQQVKFATNKYAVLPPSHALLDQVVQVLRDHPAMKVRIEGHTDNVGRDAANLALSQRRAASVKAYLVKKGIDPSRLEAVGHGATRPIASNRTAQGKAQNRRTEFHIVATE